MPQNIMDTIKSNIKEFEGRVAGKPDAPPQKDYFAHNWTPPKGRKPPPKADDSAPTRKKVARKR